MWLVTLALLSTPATAEILKVSPGTPKQGDIIEVTAPPPATHARMRRRKVPLFPDGNGGMSGLMPVGVNDRPGAVALEILDRHGKRLSTMPIRIQNARFPTQNVRLGAATAALKPSPGELEAVRALRYTVTDNRHWARPFVKPVPGCMNSPFGVARLHNGKPTGRYHSGVDQRGPEGQPIRAFAAGTVQIARMFNIHGGTVGIDHGHGMTSNYLHMSQFAVKEGDRVNAGDVIGFVGSTGRSTGPHLHWGVTVNGIAVNPETLVDLPPCAAPAKPRPRSRYPQSRK